MDGFRLVTVAVDNFPDPFETLPSSGIADRVAWMLAECGAVRVGPLSATDNGSIRDFVERWALEPAGPAPSILYWVSHGDSDGERLWLLASDSAPPYRASNAISDRELAHLLVEFWHARGADDPEPWVLVVLDCCGGAVGASSVVAELVARPDRPRRFGVFAVSSQGASTAGRFADALAATLATFTENDSAIPLQSLFLGVEGRIKADPNWLGSFADVVLTNPRRAPATLTVNVDLLAEWRSFLDRLEPDVRAHFLAKAAGTDGQLAWQFSGRVAESRRVVDWLGRAPSGVFVVTGEAGAGKSALLGRLVVLADERVREELRRFELIGDVEPHDRPQRAFDLVMNLTGRTAADVLGRIGEEFGSADLSSLAASLQSAGRPVTLLFDGLDEAQEPHAVAARVLAPLAATPNVRVVVGTRRSLAEGPDLPAAPTAELLDALRAPADATLVLPREPAAMADYVRQRLAPLGAELASTVSARIDAIDQPFLYARLITTELLESKGTADIGRLLSGSYRDVFALAVERLGASSPTTVALLRALGFALGRGLPRADRVWATVAAALTPDASFGELDVDVALEAASSFITLDGEDGQSVYRLSHRTFAEHFLAAAESAAGHRRIAETLVGVTRAGGWAQANTYTLRRVLAHAGADLALAESVASDPAYLDATLRRLGVDGLVEGLVAASRTNPTTAMAALAGAVRRARVALDRDPDQLAGQLYGRLQAVDEAAIHSLVAGLAQIAPDVSLRPLHSSLDWRTSVETMQDFPRKIRALSFCSIDGRSWVAVGSGSQLCLWDPLAGAVDLNGFDNDGLRITSLACGEWFGEPVAALGARYDGVVTLRSLRDGRLLGRFDGIGVRAVAFTSSDGHAVLAIVDDNALVLWDLDAVEPSRVRSDAVSLDAFGLGGAEPVALAHTSAGLFVAGAIQGAIEIRAVNSGATYGDIGASLGIVQGLALAEVDGRVLVAAGITDTGAGFVSLWDVGTGHPVGSVTEPGFPVRCVAIAAVGDAVVTAAANDADAEFGYVRIADPHGSRMPSLGMWTSRTVWAFGRYNGQLVALVEADALELLSVPSGAVFDRRPGPQAIARLLLGVEAPPHGLLRTGADGRLSLSEPPYHPVGADGAFRRDDPASWPARSLAYGLWDGSGAVGIVGSYQGAIWVWDLATQRCVAGPFVDLPESIAARRAMSKPGLAEVRSVSLLQDGDGALVATACDGRLTVWDVRTAGRLAVPRAADAITEWVALGRFDGRLVLARAGAGGSIAVWDLNGGERIAALTLDDPLAGLWFVAGEPLLVALSRTDGALQLLKLVAR